MKFAYQRTGSGLVKWGQAAPSQSRAAEAVSLGSLGDNTLNPRMPLPLPGAPEPLPYSMGCSSCPSMGGAADIPNILNNAPLSYKVAAGVGAYLLYKHFTKRR